MAAAAKPQTQIAAAIPPTGPTPDGTVRISTAHPIPVPAEGELLVKLEYSGVCHSDVHSVKGDTPMLTDVAGHEGIGKVISGESCSLARRHFEAFAYCI